MTAPRTEEELKKLTVIALKAICKEHRLTGYSKLSKPAIIAKILAHEPKSAPATSQSSLSPQNQIADILAAGSKRPNDDSNTHAEPVQKKAKSLPKDITQPLQLPAQRNAIHPVDLGQQSQFAPVQKNVSQPSGSPRLSPSVTQQPTVVNTVSAIPQSSRPALQPSGNFPLVQPSTCPPKAAVQAPHNQPDKPADPARNPKLHSKSTTTAVSTGTVGTLKTPGKRFTPLVINRTISTKAFEIKKPANTTDVPYLDFVGNVIVPSLGPISLPPSLAERKVIDKVSLALSQVDEVDLGQCVQVSRMFRYAGKGL